MTLTRLRGGGAAHRLFAFDVAFLEMTSAFTISVNHVHMELCARLQVTLKQISTKNTYNVMFSEIGEISIILDVCKGLSHCCNILTGSS